MQEDCKQVSVVRNNGLSCLPLLIIIEVFLFSVLNQNAFQYISSVVEDAKMKLIQATTLKCCSSYVIVHRKEKVMQKYGLLLT